MIRTYSHALVVVAIATLGSTVGIGSAWGQADGDPTLVSVPMVYPYSGVLEIDAALPSFDAAIRFTLYSDPSGEEAFFLWDEEWSDEAGSDCDGDPDLDPCLIPVYNGHFTVMLGRFNTDLDAVITDAQRVWLGVTVRHPDGGWVPLLGTVALDPAPYALWSIGTGDLNVSNDLTVHGDVIASCLGGTCAASEGVLSVVDATIAGQVTVARVLSAGIGGAPLYGASFGGSLNAAGDIRGRALEITPDVGRTPSADGPYCNVFGGDIVLNGRVVFDTGSRTDIAFEERLEDYLVIAGSSNRSGTWGHDGVGMIRIRGPLTINGNIDSELARVGGDLVVGVNTFEGDRDIVRIFRVFFDQDDSPRREEIWDFNSDNINQSECTEDDPDCARLSGADWHCFLGGFRFNGEILANLNDPDSFMALTYLDGDNEWMAAMHVPNNSWDGPDGLNREMAAICIQRTLVQVDSWFESTNSLIPQPCDFTLDFGGGECTCVTGNTVEGGCCDELTACQGDPECSCMWDCSIVNGGDFGCWSGCNMGSGFPPPNWVDLQTCVENNNCANVTPAHGVCPSGTFWFD